MTRPQTEILVHIAAASRASDDVRYRALARAYADFEPAGRFDILSSTPQKDCGDSSGNVIITSFEDHRQPGGSSISVAGGRSFQFASLSFESVWDNAQSPGVALVPLPKRGTTGPAPLNRPPPQRRHQYVSPDDCIPDSQPENEPQVGRRRTICEDDLELSFCGFDDSRIVESQEAGSGTGKGDEEEEQEEEEDDDCDLEDIMNREAASPDLSVMPMGLEDSRLADSKVGEPQDQLQPLLPRQPLSQRSANSQQSSQQDDGDDGSLKSSSLPLHGWEVVPSSGNAHLRDRSVGPSVEYGMDIPSSLPEEAGKVVIMVDSFSCEPRESSASQPSVAALGLPRADSEPTGTKRRRVPEHADVSRATSRRRASDAGQPLHKKTKRITADSDFASSSAATHEECHRTVDCKAETIPALGTGGGIGTFGDALPASMQQFPSSSPTPSAPGLYLDKSLRIISPEPPVACGHLDAASLVTEKMAKLACDLNLERRYRPSPPSPKEALEGRVVRPFERGYWRLNTSGWPATLRYQAWAYLSGYVGNGDAGWSVWCSRDPAPHTWLRLHCFAATAGHTYLILYLASQRQILTTGAVWLDGSGTPTITVRPRKKKQQQQQQQQQSGVVDVFNE